MNQGLMLLGIIMTVPVVISAVKALFNRKITVDLLASIALFVSLIEREWSSVVFINLMIICAKLFGIYTESKAKNTIKSLLKLRPNFVKIKVNNQIKNVELKQIKIGDVAIIESGERIPVDGKVISGQASVDQSSLTGESMPIEKSKNDEVYSSTLCLSGSLLVLVTKLEKDSTFEKLIKLIEEAQLGKNDIASAVDKFSSWYILLTLLGSGIIWGLTRNISLVLSILLVTCADDIAVAVPLAFWAAIASGAKRGIIIKGGEKLELLAKCKLLIVDKTGTLTKGKIKVNHVFSFGISEKSLENLAAMAESISDHPMALAIVEYAHKLKIKYSMPDKFVEIPGKGLEVSWHNHKIVVGNVNFLRTKKININFEHLEKIKSTESDGHNVVLLAVDGQLQGLIALGDEIRFGMRNAINKLKQLGVERVVMLTGDNRAVAKTVSNEIGINEYHSDLLPQDKVKFIKKSLNNKYTVAMVGDGINDAAGLTIADVGFVMGAIGSDSAIEAADIALMNDNFGKVAETIKMSKSVVAIVKQNFLIWGVVNIVGLGLVFGGVMGPTEAAAYNFVSDFLPLLNSMRLFWYNF